MLLDNECRVSEYPSPAGPLSTSTWGLRYLLEAQFLLLQCFEMPFQEDGLLSPMLPRQSFRLGLFNPYFLNLQSLFFDLAFWVARLLAQPLQ